jgi:hypothetical protein
VSNGSEKCAWGLDAWWGGECGFFLLPGASWLVSFPPLQVSGFPIVVVLHPTM